MTKIASWLVLVTGVLTFLGQAQANTAFALSSPNEFRNNAWSFGDIFTVGAQDIYVTALGAYDDNGDGFVTPGGIPVGIFRESDNALLASVFVTSGDPLSASFRYVSISPLTLLAGESYRVVADNESDNYNFSTNLTVDPAITFNGYGYCQTTALTSCNAFTGSDIVWMANFQFNAGTSPVPEPVSMLLTGSALLGLGLVRSRRRA